MTVKRNEKKNSKICYIFFIIAVKQEWKLNDTKFKISNKFWPMDSRFRTVVKINTLLKTNAVLIPSQAYGDC